MENTELLPCPICGNKEIYLEQTSKGYGAVCYKCGIGFVETNWTRDYVVKTWNKRTAVASNNGFNLTPPVDGAS
jgi:transcription elongation factor Elf1